MDTRHPAFLFAQDERRYREPFGQRRRVRCRLLPEEYAQAGAVLTRSPSLAPHSHILSVRARELDMVDTRRAGDEAGRFLRMVLPTAESPVTLPRIARSWLSNSSLAMAIGELSATL